MRKRSLRRRLPYAIAAIVALVVGAALVVLPDGSTVKITPYRGSVPHFSVAGAYHVTYAVSGASTQELFVRRPFDSYELQISHGKPILTMAMRLGTQVLRSKSGPATLVYTALAPSRRDVRLDVVAREAIRTKRLRLVGRARVLDTTCYVFRSAAPLNSGPLQPIGTHSYVDSCVDRRGLVLYERTVADDEVTSTRRATNVVLDTRGARFAMHGDASPQASGGGGMRPLTLDSRPESGPFWDMAHAPSGFRHVGRYAVVPSQPQAYAAKDGIAANPFGLPGSLVASIDDVYVRGADALVIEQGSTVNDAKFKPATGGVDIELGEVLGKGQLLLSASASEVDAEPHEGRRFVRVVGTLPPDELVALARSMTLQPAGTMKRL